MMTNVCTWAEAARRQLPFGLFTYDHEKIPSGEITAELQFKIWSKKLMAINCYFRSVETGEQFMLTVFCNRKGYYLPKQTLDFATCPTNVLYRVRIEVINNRKKLACAELL